VATTPFLSFFFFFFLSFFYDYYLFNFEGIICKF